MPICQPKLDRRKDLAEAFRLSDVLVKKPARWCQSGPVPSDTSVLNFVKFRAFYRAVTQYRSIVQLLKSGQWEDAIILFRSLYDLNVNLSEIEREEDAKKFVRFGGLQIFRLEQRSLEDQLRDEKSKPLPSAQVITELEGELKIRASQLERDFAEFGFRNPKGKWKWQDSWSGVSIEELSRRLAKKTGGQQDQNDYYVFRIASLFTHNTPAALLYGLNPPTVRDWNQARGGLDEAGRNALREFLYATSVCLVDILGMAGDLIVGYERQWFDEAIGILEKLKSTSRLGKKTKQRGGSKERKKSSHHIR